MQITHWEPCGHNTMRQKGHTFVLELKSLAISSVLRNFATGIYSYKTIKQNHGRESAQIHLGKL